MNNTKIKTLNKLIDNEESKEVSEVDKRELAEKVRRRRYLLPPSVNKDTRCLSRYSSSVMKRMQLRGVKIKPMTEQKLHDGLELSLDCKPMKDEYSVEVAGDSSSDDSVGVAQTNYLEVPLVYRGSNPHFYSAHKAAIAMELSTAKDGWAKHFHAVPRVWEKGF